MPLFLHVLDGVRKPIVLGPYNDLAALLKESIGPVVDFLVVARQPIYDFYVTNERYESLMKVTVQSFLPLIRLLDALGYNTNPGIPPGLSGTFILDID
jgi:hypothetical protein